VYVVCRCCYGCVGGRVRGSVIPGTPALLALPIAKVCHTETPLLVLALIKGIQNNAVMLKDGRNPNKVAPLVDMISHAKVGPAFLHTGVE
jgi:hypothetical protein